MRQTMSVLLATGMVVAGCATVGQSELREISVSPPAGQARIFLLRENATLYVLRSAPIKIDGKAVGDLANGGVLYLDKTPGDYLVSSENWDTPGRFAIKLHVDAGNTYFLKVSPKSDLLVPMVAAGLVGLYAQSKLADTGGLFAIAPIDVPAGQAMLSAAGYRWTKEKEASSPPEQQSTETDGRKSSNQADQLRELYKLYQEGVITEQDYQAKKKQILDRM